MLHQMSRQIKELRGKELRGQGTEGSELRTEEN